MSKVYKAARDGSQQPFNLGFLDSGTGILDATRASVDANGNIISPEFVPSNGAHGQVSVGTTATLIAAARTGRKNILVLNEGTTDVRIGVSSAVTTGTGLLLVGAKGQGILLDGGAAVYGIVGSGSQVVSCWEAF